MNRVFLLLGGNLGNKSAIFKEAQNILQKKLGKIVKKSSIYETEPWGFKAKDNFWNQALILETSLSPKNVLKITKETETELGRIREEKRYTSRTIDIDVLFWGNLIIDEPNLEIPHPRMINRRFVLIPLSEIAPEMIHPVFKKTITELLDECTDTLEVEKIKVESTLKSTNDLKLYNCPFIYQLNTKS